ncbi:MAG TPA: DUF707 domain-containing protein [Luteolibacter sp.]
MNLDEFVLLLEEFIASNAEQLWIIDKQIWHDCEWNVFEDSLQSCNADFLATAVRSRTEDPEWNWWASLHANNEADPSAHGVAALLPLIRVSQAAAEAILRGIKEGWVGHPEALIPTLVNRAGLKIEDIGGTGSFTPLERIGRWYDQRTWHWKGPVEHVSGKLHYPVPIHTRPLAPSRISHTPSANQDDNLKLLYVSPVGSEAAKLLPDVLDCFLKAGSDCLLLQYDDAALEVPDEVGLIRDQGYKWQLAFRHLHPDIVSEYDYLFFWDDDLGVKDFDPQRFARIMRTNRLDMAQPAIETPHGLSHPITKRKPCPPPRRRGDGKAVRTIVGRTTNFVEIMAPVFTHAAWREFYGYLDPDNRSGWGYDYIPLGRKGIVDVLPVVHTRAVQSMNAGSQAELQRFLNDQGLFRHAAVDMGWLFE